MTTAQQHDKHCLLTRPDKSLPCESKKGDAGWLNFQWQDKLNVQLKMNEYSNQFFNADANSRSTRASPTMLMQLVVSKGPKKSMAVKANGILPKPKRSAECSAICGRSDFSRRFIHKTYLKLTRLRSHLNRRV